MNLDTRARRAADGVRASTRRVDPMAQITELRHEDQTRRRAKTTAVVLGATLVVAGAGWFAVTQVGGSSDSAPADPLSTPSADSVVNLEPGPTVGTRMIPSLSATAPDSWGVFKNGQYVNLGGPGVMSGTAIEIDGPLLQVSAKSNSDTSISPDEYASWLREHPSLTVLDDRMVVIVWTWRDASRHIISMRYCHEKEEKRWRKIFRQAGHE